MKSFAMTGAALAAVLTLAACGGGETTNDAAANVNDAQFDNLTNSYEELPMETANGGLGNDALANDTLGNAVVPATGAGGAPTSNASAVGN